MSKTQRTRKYRDEHDKPKLNATARAEQLFRSIRPEQFQKMLEIAIGVLKKAPPEFIPGSLEYCVISGAKMKDIFRFAKQNGIKLDDPFADTIVKMID